MRNLKEESNEAMKDGLTEIKKSSKDWINYLQSHLLQSILFSIVTHFAVKGMMLNNKD